MKKFKGEIKNEKGKIIFSKVGKFENKQSCLEALYEKIYVDVPSSESLLYSMIYGGDFESSPYCLSKYYEDISKLTFNVTEL